MTADDHYSRASQKCSECGRESPIGKPFEHYVGCDHWESSGNGQGPWGVNVRIDHSQGPHLIITTSHGAGVSE